MLWSPRSICSVVCVGWYWLDFSSQRRRNRTQRRRMVARVGGIRSQLYDAFFVRGWTEIPSAVSARRHCPELATSIPLYAFYEQIVVPQIQLRYCSKPYQTTAVMGIQTYTIFGRQVGSHWVKFLSSNAFCHVHGSELQTLRSLPLQELN